jgi:hypothetical protein
MMKDIA